MAGTSLLVLIDDITTVLDDVAAMSKTAAQKTTGVLGDDLALNAQQVSGIRAERELPVVWAVAKGSFRNKLILVPSALTLSAIAPWSIGPILMIGGAYLCFEGFEKIIHPFLVSKDADEHRHNELIDVLHHPDTDMAAYEKSKIEGAIRTDFVLSAEIIVIALGTVADKEILTQAIVVSGVAVLMTVGVYGVVAAIVKMDDAGLHLLQNAPKGKKGLVHRIFGSALLSFAPRLMKILTVVGTAAMFLVGGGILVHSIPFSHSFIEIIEQSVKSIPSIGALLEWAAPFVVNMVAGVISGGIVMSLVKAVSASVSRIRK